MRRCMEYLADVTTRELGGEAVQSKPLMLAGELVGCVNLHVTGDAECCLVGAAYNRGVRLLAHITLDLHLPRFLSQMCSPLP